MKILIGGSPCTHWSIAQTKNRETEASGIGWELFLNYRIARDKYQPDFFLYENNKSMSPAIRAQITAELGVEPVLINSALVSAQNASACIGRADGTRTAHTARWRWSNRRIVGSSCVTFWKAASAGKKKGMPYCPQPAEPRRAAQLPGTSGMALRNLYELAKLRAQRRKPDLTPVSSTKSIPLTEKPRHYVGTAVALEQKPGFMPYLCRSL